MEINKHNYEAYFNNNPWNFCTIWLSQLSSMQKAGSARGSCRKRIPGEGNAHRFLLAVLKYLAGIHVQLHLKCDNAPSKIQINYLKAGFTATKIKLPLLDSQPGTVTGSKVINWEHLHKQGDLLRTTKGLEQYIGWMKKGSNSKKT